MKTDYVITVITDSGPIKTWTQTETQARVLVYLLAESSGVISVTIHHQGRLKLLLTLGGDRSDD